MRLTAKKKRRKAERQTTPSGDAVHPSTEGNELQNASKAKPASPRREPPKIVGGPGGQAESQGRPLAIAVGTAMEVNTSGRPERASPPGAWIQGPGRRVLGPQGFTGASGHAPVEKPATRIGWQFRPKPAHAAGACMKAHPPGWRLKEPVYRIGIREART